MKTFVLVGLSLFCAACSNEVEHPEPMRSTPDFGQVTLEQWASLSRRTFYFGHQSVGADIIDGVREISAQRPEIALRVVSGSTAAVPGALNEFRVGRNEDPESKNAAIVQATSGALGPNPVLMFKYCYVDVHDKTDAAKLFERYRQTVVRLRAQHPDATVVHLTVPLMTEPSLLRYVMNKVRGMATSREENAVRAEYNRLLRAEYSGKEPIFDLAALESTRSDGTLEYGVVDGAKVPALAREWAADTGHLNVAGRRQVAEQFLATLATLPGADQQRADLR